MIDIDIIILIPVAFIILVISLFSIIIKYFDKNDELKREKRKNNELKEEKEKLHKQVLYHLNILRNEENELTNQKEYLKLTINENKILQLQLNNKILELQKKEKDMEKEKEKSELPSVLIRCHIEPKPERSWSFNLWDLVKDDNISWEMHPYDLSWRRLCKQMMKDD